MKGEPGRRVHHPRYGEGRVLRVERGGLSLRVLFDAFPGLEVSLPARLLKLAEGETQGLGGMRPREGSAEKGGPGGLLVSRQVLEALRLGVVPTQGLLAYTVGRDREVEAFLGILEEREPRKALAFLGDYGAGKTHLLELVQHLALERNWVVGRAWLDPQEAPPSKPRRVYASLVRSLIYPDSREAGEQGLLPLLERGVSKLDGDFRDGEGRRHVFLSAALSHARALTEALEADPGDPGLALLQMHFCDWIEGRAVGLSQDLQRRLHARLGVRDRVLALSDFSTLSRVYGYLLSGLSLLARRVGYRGLLLLLDETELFSSLSLEHRARAVEVFRVLLSAALPPEGEGSLDLSEVGKGGRGIIRELPARFGGRSFLAIGLAATPGSESEHFLRETLGEGCVLELGTFGGGEFREMGDRILNLYLEAHPGLSRRVLAALEDRMGLWLSRGLPMGPREFGRRVVDFLDQCRHTRADFG